jgi:hypothetical protein
MEKPYRLNVKLPAGGEFEAEGSEETVKELFAQFLDVIRSIPQPAISSQAAANQTSQPASADPQAEATITARATSEMDRASLDRLFSMDRTGTVSLRALPRGDERDAEALLALLFGFNALRGDTDVTAVRLMRAAKQSGIQVERLDRIIGSQSQYINSAGFGKGKRYGLNNPGLVRAQEILVSILG